MQAEGTSNSADSLENFQYSGQPQVVLDGSSLSENQNFTQEGMGELKRPLENDDDDDDDSTGHSPADPKPAKKTRGRVKIDMKFITNKLRRYTTFSKRKTGIMKKVTENELKSTPSVCHSLLFLFFPNYFSLLNFHNLFSRHTSSAR